MLIGNEVNVGSVHASKELNQEALLIELGEEVGRIAALRTELTVVRGYYILWAYVEWRLHFYAHYLADGIETKHYLSLHCLGSSRLLLE